ncbi:dephospho-CoA kinase [Sulfuricystis multivorans]|uniref:dephospho-CoA kinase n=1 Tax=Sulfuricystis multivorans TaxID=2211108 RepID=UPI000F82CCD5|nr:dephospho-CoA kinase [Sulfuricystis multivorans]
MSFVVGLTGGIGSGKSAAAERFAARGVPIVDTDAIARALTAPGGAAIAPIRAAFGDAVLTSDGALDRAAMRRWVFADPNARKRLEAILHPMIRAESEAHVSRCANAEYLILVVPLLIEAGDFRSRVDRICVVDCPEEIQIARVMARSGLSREEVQAIIAAQASRVARLTAADDVIDNSRGLAELDAQVASLHEKYRLMARARQESSRTP